MDKDEPEKNKLFMSQTPLNKNYESKESKSKEIKLSIYKVKNKKPIEMSDQNVHQSQKNLTDKKIFDLNQIVNLEFEKINNILNNFIGNSLSDQIEKINLISNETGEKFNSVNQRFNEIEININCINQDLNKKILFLKESLITQLNNQNKEIEDFQQKQNIEYDDFNNKVRNSINDHISQLKTIYEYTNKDIDLIRNKNQYLQNSINQLRQDVFESIKESDNFLLNKIENSSRSNQQ